MQFQSRRQVYKSGSVFSIGPTTAKYVVLMLLGLFSLMFLIEAAQGADKKIEISKVESQKVELGKELKTLELNATRLQSSSKLSEQATKQGLTAIEKDAETISISN